MDELQIVEFLAERDISLNEEEKKQKVEKFNELCQQFPDNIYLNQVRHGYSNPLIVADIIVHKCELL